MRFSFRVILPLVFFGAVFASCGRKPMHVVNAETAVIMVDSSLDVIQDSAYLAELQPLKASLDSLSGEVIGYVPEPMEAFRPESPLLNWAADALLFPIRMQRPDEADFAVVNIGGLRCSWPAGELTVRSVFELMPFDNEVVILTLKGEDVLLLADQIAAQNGQGVSGMRLEIKNGKARKVRVQGKAVEPEKIYHVVTSDYLSGGADGLDMLSRFTSREMVGITVRDQYIGYAKMLTAEGQPIKEVADGRIKVVR